MQAVAGKLTGRHVVADAAGLRALGEQVTDEGVQVLLSPGDVLAPVQDRGKLAAGMLVLDHREYLQDGLQLPLEKS